MFGLPRLYAALGAAFLLAAFLGWVARIDHLRAAYKRDLAACEQSKAQVIADVRAKTVLAQAQDAANAARVEAAQAQKGQQISEDYQTQLAALRARYDSLRAGKAGSDTGRGGNQTVPIVPGSAPVADAATTPCPLNEFNAEANALQLGALQDWVKSVSGVR